MEGGYQVPVRHLVVWQEIEQTGLVDPRVQRARVQRVMCLGLLVHSQRGTGKTVEQPVLVPPSCFLLPQSQYSQTPEHATIRCI